MGSLLCGEALRLAGPSPFRRAQVEHILECLFSLNPISPDNRDRGIELLIHGPPEGDILGELVFDSPCLSACRNVRGYDLRSRGSFLALDVCSGRAAGSLSASFPESPLKNQHGLLLFAFLLLLSARGLHGQYAGGVALKALGFLLVGESGSGKTTLTLAFTTCGWQYLSDDSVLLKRTASGIEAVARGVKAPATGKRLVDIRPIYQGRYRSAVRPRVVLFPEIAAALFSRILPLSHAETLIRMLAEGACLLNDRDSVAAQMAVRADPARVSALLSPPRERRRPHS